MNSSQGRSSGGDGATPRTIANGSNGLTIDLLSAIILRYLDREVVYDILEYLIGRQGVGEGDLGWRRNRGAEGYSTAVFTWLVNSLRGIPTSVLQLLFTRLTILRNTSDVPDVVDASFAQWLSQRPSNNYENLLATVRRSKDARTPAQYSVADQVLLLILRDVYAEPRKTQLTTYWGAEVQRLRASAQHVLLPAPVTLTDLLGQDQNTPMAAPVQTAASPRMSPSYTRTSTLNESRSNREEPRRFDAQYSHTPTFGLLGQGHLSTRAPETTFENTAGSNSFLGLSGDGIEAEVPTQSTYGNSQNSQYPSVRPSAAIDQQDLAGKTHKRKPNRKPAVDLPGSQRYTKLTREQLNITKDELGVEGMECPVSGHSWHPMSDFDPPNAKGYQNRTCRAALDAKSAKDKAKKKREKVEAARANQQFQEIEDHVEAGRETRINRNIPSTSTDSERNQARLDRNVARIERDFVGFPARQRIREELALSRGQRRRWYFAGGIRSADEQAAANELFDADTRHIFEVIPDDHSSLEELEEESEWESDWSDSEDGEESAPQSG